MHLSAHPTRTCPLEETRLQAGGLAIRANRPKRRGLKQEEYERCRAHSLGVEHNPREPGSKDVDSSLFLPGELVGFCTTEYTLYVVHAESALSSTI